MKQNSFDSLQGTPKLRAGILAAQNGENITKGCKTNYSAAAQIDPQIREDYIAQAEQKKAAQIKGAKAPNVKDLLNYAKELKSTRFGRLTQLLPTSDQEKLLWLNVRGYRWAYNQFYADYRDKSLFPYRLECLLIELNECLQKFGFGISEKPPAPKQVNWTADYSLVSKKSGNQPEWMSEGVLAVVLNSCARSINEAAEYPAGFRSKNKALPEFSIRQGDSVKIGKDTITLPIIGAIRHTRPNYIPTDAKVCGVGLSYKNGKWYAGVSLSIDTPKPELRTTGKTIGIDVGCRKLAVGWDGENLATYDDKSHDARLLRLEKDKKRWQRRADRRYKRGAKEQSQRYYFAQNQVRRISQEITNIRKDNSHQVSHRLLRGDTKEVVVESLNVKGLMTKSKEVGKKSHGKGTRKSLAEASLGRLLTNIIYKAKWRGIKVIEADQFFPSSKVCSACWIKNDDLGSEEYWTCSSCNVQHNRDENASKILQRYGADKEFRKTWQEVYPAKSSAGTPNIEGQAQSESSANPDISLGGLSITKEIQASNLNGCSGAEMSCPIDARKGTASGEAMSRAALSEIKQLANDMPRQKVSARKPQGKRAKSLKNDGVGGNGN
jgi:putative transposase